MKKIIFSIVLNLILLVGYSQNQAVVKIKIPAKQNVMNTKLLPVAWALQSFNHKIFFKEPYTENYLLLFNEYPLLKSANNGKKNVSLLTQLSFADVLESSMNKVKTGLINTYDDNISELFKDAPSLLQFTCIISF